MPNILDEFDYRPDRTADYGISCPWASKMPSCTYNGADGVARFSWLFFGPILYYFLVMRTCMKAWTTLNFRQIRLLTTDLAAH